jgi:choice-of-anchor B domain-containing protein
MNRGGAITAGALPHLWLAAALLPAMPADAQTRAWRPLEAPVIGFGASVLMHGDHLYVGRTGLVTSFPFGNRERGAVHEFRAGPDGAWAEAGRIESADAAEDDAFGTDMARDGDLLAVGAPHHAAGGAVFVFRRGAGGWEQTARLALPDAAAGDEFGARVALEGALLAAGAPGRSAGRGAVYAFRLENGEWSAPVIVTAGPAEGDRMGAAVALSGGKVLVGAPGTFGGGALFGEPIPPRAGMAAVHVRSPDGTWREEARLSPAPDATWAFGMAVLLRGDQALVGAPGAGQGQGMAYAFRRDGEAWTLAGRLAPAAATALFGASLAWSGGVALIGAPGADNGTGAVHAFALEESGWTETQRLTVPSSGIGVLFGAAVAVAGDRAVVGGPLGEFFEGAAWAWRRDATGRWHGMGTLVDHPAGLPAITGGERRCTDGAVDIFPCQDVHLLSFLPVADLGGSRGIMLNDIWGWTHAPSGREFALVGRMDGTAFVEVTDPANPVYLGELPMTPGARANLWRDIKVYRDHAFIVADGAGQHGMQVFDLSRLLNVRQRPARFTADTVYDRIASAHNIAINEETGFAYAVGNSAGGETCGGALHMIDIREPKRPVFAGCFADPTTGMQRTGYTHDSQCVLYRGPDEAYRGREICFNASETAVGIADVTDKANPRPIAVASYPNTAYAHQGWLSEDHRYFFLNDEGDELAGTVPRTRTLVWDVQRLEEPMLVREFLGTTAASDHNLYIRGTYMFQSNYVAGVRVIDVSDPVNPREVGYFDTVPWGENLPGFAGSWSNYPFFPSGTIVATSMREGLFVLRHEPSRPMVP